MTATGLPSERAKLLEAALKSNDPQAFLMGMQSAFRYAGRYGDFTLAARLRDLFYEGEIEVLMYLKAQWQGGLLGK